jgi:hypothetical protein
LVIPVKDRIILGSLKGAVKMKKIDLKKELKPLYSPKSKKVEIVNIPEMNFLMIDGKGDPNTSAEFQQAVEALFSLSYTIKFKIKKGAQAIDYGVMPLEGLWWADEMSTFSIEEKEDWKWTLMIMQPEFVKKSLIAVASEELEKKKNPPALPNVRFETYIEGDAAQIMHIGPFSEEGPTVEKVHAFIEENDKKNSGKHHEIYLSDFRRAAPEKLKTIIRQPMA